MSVDGNSASGFNSLTSGNVSVVDLFNGAPDGSFYVDAVPAAVPEPGSWVIAALAALIIALTHCVRLSRAALTASVENKSPFASQERR